MTCAATGWNERSPWWRYRACYNPQGASCCRVDMRALGPKAWAVSVRRGGGPSIRAAAGLPENKAEHLASELLRGCGCSGVEGSAMGGLGRRERRCGR
jgi:hypothetical protein